MTDSSQKTIHIKYVRSGIGFDTHTKTMIRSLGLRHLHQVVERQNTPQIRGLVARIPHFVEIVEPQVKPAWTSTPEFTLFPPEPKPVEEKKAAAETVPEAEVEKAEVAVAAEPEHKEKKKAAAHAETGKHKKTAKHAEPTKHPAKEKGKAAKAEHPKKHAKAADAKHGKHAAHDKKGKK